MNEPDLLPIEPGAGEQERELPSDLGSDPNFRSGFVAVVGRPNVGKSTLINRLLGQKVSIVSPKPQTTRNRLLGILTLDQAQVIFLDTPGIHNPVHQLGRVLNETASSVLPDADVVLWVVDTSVPPNDEDERVAGLVTELPPVVPLVLALNKVDRVEGKGGGNFSAHYADLAPRAEPLRVSATQGINLDTLIARLVALLPFGPLLYPEEQVTDQQVRFMAGELVREQVLLHLRDEVPHSVAVLVNEFEEREDITYISAVVYVERDTQKMIILGKDGQMIKRIGQAARQQVEELLEGRVYLDLWVKVRPKWRTDAEELRRLGYQMPKKKPGKGGGRGRARSTGRRA